jgi:hypothetical protein
VEQSAVITARSLLLPLTAPAAALLDDLHDRIKRNSNRFGSNTNPRLS